MKPGDISYRVQITRNTDNVMVENVVTLTYLDAYKYWTKFVQDYSSKEYTGTIEKIELMRKL